MIKCKQSKLNLDLISRNVDDKTILIQTNQTVLLVCDNLSWQESLTFIGFANW